MLLALDRVSLELAHQSAELHGFLIFCCCIQISLWPMKRRYSIFSDKFSLGESWYLSRFLDAKNEKGSGRVLGNLYA